MLSLDCLKRLLIVISTALIVSANGHVTDLEYELMPPLFHLDNFDKCMKFADSALYCYTTIQLSPIDPERPSQVWKIIEEVSSHQNNYRHDKLRHGLCIPYTCPHFLNSISYVKGNHTNLEYHISKFYNVKYEELGLKSTIVSLHCETESPVYEIDFYDKLVAGLLFVLVSLIGVGTFYEGCARYKSKEDYNRITSTKAGRFLACFSIPKNWNRLRSINDHPDAVALRPINSIRFYNMLLVIMAHTCMAAYAGPVLNPQFFEKISEDPINMLFLNGSICIQTYFMIAGWLLSFHFFLLFEKLPEVNFHYILIAFLNRYIRLTPTFGVVIAISGTWLQHLSRGPIWDKLVGNEYRNCRKNWWVNLLYINNYYDSRHMCVQQSWYLAADTQLFVLSLLIVYLMWKNRQRIKTILSISLILAILTLGASNYISGYDIIVRHYPEDMYNLMLDNTQWRNTYIPGHTNIGGYIVGLIFGCIFYNYRNKKVLTGKVKITIWWMLSWSLPLSMIFLAVPMYKQDFERSVVVISIYVALCRSIFALGIAIAVFGVSQGIGWFIRDAVYWKPLQVLGRISYCAYLVHVLVIRIRCGLIRTPFYANTYILITETLKDATLSYILALLLCLFVELPISALQKILLTQLEEKRRREQITKKVK